MKIQVGKDEAYPVYTFRVPTSAQLRRPFVKFSPFIKTVNARTVKRWERIEALYDKMQAELKKVYES